MHDVQQLAALAPIDAVICELEPCVDVAARVCGRLGIPFTSASAVTVARDKTRAREVILRAGLHCPRFRPVTTPQEARAAAEAIGTPVVVKPQPASIACLPRWPLRRRRPNLRPRNFYLVSMLCPTSFRLNFAKESSSRSILAVLLFPPR